MNWHRHPLFNRRRRRALAGVGIAASLASLPLGVRAADFVVDAASGNSPYGVASGNASYGNIYVGRTTTGVLNQTGGTLTASGQLLIGAAAAASSGTYSLSGGTLHTVSTDVGDFSTAVFTLSGNGVHNVTGVDGNSLGSLGIGYDSGSNGTYNPTAARSRRATCAATRARARSTSTAARP